MNNLSNRIRTALETPVLQDIRKTSTLHPSSSSVELSKEVSGRKVSGACLRAQYYKYTGVPVSNVGDANLKVSSLIGDKITEFVQDILDQHGLQLRLQRVVAEHSFYIPEINLSGRCDFIAYDHANKETIGIEVKSVGEHKASKTVEKPAEEHVMQSLIYLDYYSKNHPELAIKKWYILYVSRTENYAIKGKKHGSPLTMIWDYFITIDPKDGAAIIHTSKGTEKWSEYTISKIYDRYKKLISYITIGQEPPRDYNYQYDEATIAGLYKNKELTRKTDTEKVEKWLKKGAPPGKLKVEIGDIECVYCSHKAICWPGLVDKNEHQVDNSLMESLNKTTEITPPDDKTPSIWI